MHDTFDTQTCDPMQIIFDGAEAVQDALHHQEGCIMALILIIDRLPPQDRQCEHMLATQIESLALYRTEALSQVQRLQKVSMG